MDNPSTVMLINDELDEQEFEHVFRIIALTLQYFGVRKIECCAILIGDIETAGGSTSALAEGGQKGVIFHRLINDPNGVGWMPGLVPLEELCGKPS